MQERAHAGTRVDLHLHSRASGTASNWWVRGLGADVEARESYTPPEKAYRMSKRAGMDFVTLTDHETIEGALTLLHHSDFFVGEEVSARFPEDGSYVDVLVYELDAASHREVQARRDNVHGLVDYLREAGLIHVLAHPIYGMPNPVTRRGVEKRLVLFGLWELMNGSRPAEQNRLAAEIAARVDAAELRQLSARHGLPAPPHRSITGTGGSDDHGGIYGGAAHTVAPEGIMSAGEFLEAMADGEVRPAGRSGSVAGIVHTGFRIAGEAVKEGDGAGENGRGDGVLERLAVRASLALPSAVPSALPFFRPSGAAKKKLLGYVPRLARLPEPEVREALAGRYEARLSEVLSGMGSGFPAVDFLSSVGDLIDGHLYVAPYVGVHGYFGRERNKSKALRRELFPEQSEALKTGVFVDGMDGVHGVTTMYRNLQARSEGQHAGRLRLVRCGSRTAEGYSLRQIASLPVPLYDGLVLAVPSLLDVLEHIAEEGYDVLHVATPGPLGLAALVSGIALGLPVVGAYHTEFGLYARALSGDAFVAEIVDVAVRQFYERCSAVAVPSGATALALRNRGYRIRRFEVFKNGVDTDLFHPSRRDEKLHHALGGGKTLLLYAGRVSREKDLDGLAEGYLDLRHRGDVHLVVAGDGPHRAELEARLGDAATFTGFLSGEELARVFASCDVFVFPSTTDTLGMAVAEAQASGLPAVVRGTGGPRECIRPGISGLVADLENDQGFFAGVESLLGDPVMRRRMGREAREFAETLSWEAVLDSLTSLHAQVAGIEPEPMRQSEGGWR